MTPITITVNEDVARELQYLVDLHQRHGAENPAETVEDLVSFMLDSIVDGSRRPGRWKCSMPESMRLVAKNDEYQKYRTSYGPPAERK